MAKKNALRFTFLLLFLFVSAKLSYSYTGELVESYKTPGNYSTGLTFDGKNLWVADNKADSLFCINPSTGAVLRAIPAPAYWSTDLAWDGKYLWNIDIKGGIPLAENYVGIVYQIDPKDGTILRTVQAPCRNPRGLTWDGKYLWCCDNKSDELIQFDPNDGTTIKSIKAPSGNAVGLTFDGKYLWVSDRSDDKLYMVDPVEGYVIITTDSPGNYPRGLAFDGNFLWNVDYQANSLSKLVLKDKENYLRSNHRDAKVKYTCLATNFGPGLVKSWDYYFALPSERVSQKINEEIVYSYPYSEITKDRWGQKAAHWSVKNLKAGKNAEIVVELDVTLWDIRYFIFPDRVGKLSEIPKEIKAKYLENNRKYQYDHPKIKETTKKIVGKETNPYRMARKIYNYLIDNMYYEMVGGWNTAPTVLERGNGSCSEYTFVYIAMCRSLGIPARYVGSVVMRGDESSMDDVFHRWAEIYLPNYGWIPVDPSGGDRESPAKQADCFGALDNRFLITTQSGGGSEILEWKYNSNFFYTSEPKANFVVEYFADWFPAD